MYRVAGDELRIVEYAPDEILAANILANLERNCELMVTIPDVLMGCHK